LITPALIRYATHLISFFPDKGRELINLTERTETTLLKTRLDKMQMAKLFNSQS